MAIGVLVDANVLFSRTLRDWLFLLRFEAGNADVYRIYTTRDILAEVLYRYRRAHPEAPGQTTNLIHDRISESVDDIVTTFEVFPSAIADPDDAHVHAAALACGASILLTDDGGFANSSPDDDGLPYEVHSADSFFVLVDDSVPAVVRKVTSAQFAYWQGRANAKPLDHALRNAGCPRFAGRVAAHMVRLGLRAA